MSSLFSRGAIAEGAGFKKAATWGTAVALGVADGIKLEGENLAGGEEALPVAEIGDPEGSFVERGNELWTGPIKGNLRYGGGCGRLLGMMMGGDATTDNTGTYLHTMDWTDDLAPFFTFCRGVNTTDKWWEWASGKIETLKLDWTNGGRIKWEATLIAAGLNRASSANTRTITSACLVPAGRRQIMGGHGVFRLNAQTGGALGSGDVLRVQSGSLTLKRPLSRAHETTGAGQITEPQSAGPNEILLELIFERYLSTARLDEWDAGQFATPQKADLVFSSGFTPATGQQMKWSFLFPNLALEGRPQVNVAGSGIVTHKCLYRAKRALTAPTGMTAVTAPVHALVEDELLASYMA